MSSTVACAQVAIPTQTATTAVALTVTYTQPATTDVIGLDLSTSAKITIPTTAYIGGGRALVVVECEFVANNTGDRTCLINHKDSGGTVKTTVVTSVQGAGNSVVTHLSVPMLIPDLVATDYIEVIATQTSGGNLNVSGSVRIASFKPKFPFFEGTVALVSLVTNTTTPLSFQLPATLDDAGWLFPNAPDRLQITASNSYPSMTYLVVTTAEFAANTTGDRYIWSYIVDTTLTTEYSRAINEQFPPTTVCELTTGGVLVSNVVGDVIRLSAFQKSGGNLNLNSASLWVMAVPSDTMHGLFHGPGDVSISTIEKLIVMLPQQTVFSLTGTSWDSQNPSRLVFSQPGVYIASWMSTSISASSNGYQLVTIYHRDSGGVTKNTYQGRTRRTATTNCHQAIVCIVPNVVAGDYMDTGLSTDNAVGPTGNFTFAGLVRLP